MRPITPLRALAVIVFGGIVLGAGAFVAVGGGSAVEPLLASVEDVDTTSAPPAPGQVSQSTPGRPPPTAVETPPTTSTTTSTTAPRRQLLIHGVGDVNPDESFIPALATEGHAHAWTGVGGLFAGDDLSIVNLECTPSELGVPLDKEFVFRCAPDSIPAMAAAGVDVVNLANNHSRDHGVEALLDGIEQIEAAGMAPVGVGVDADTAAAPVVVDRGGWTVAVLGFGGVVPTPDWVAGPERAGMADGDTIESMVAAVEAADREADLVVVTIHWGVELDTEPRPDDRERARAMIDAGADVVFGHHSHRLQPLERIDGAVVAWGLGNFVWPDFSPEGSTTAVARVVVAPDGEIDACLVPAIITSPGRPEVTGDAPCGPHRRP